MHSLRRNLKGAYTIWYRDIVCFFRDRLRIVVSMGQPLLFLFVFGGGLSGAMSDFGGGGVDFRQFMFPGILAMTILFTSIFSAVSIVWDREFGFLKEVMVAPVSRTAVALGKVAGGSTIAMFSRGHRARAGAGDRGHADLGSGAHPDRVDADARRDDDVARDLDRGAPAQHGRLPGDDAVHPHADVLSLGRPLPVTWSAALDETG